MSKIEIESPFKIPVFYNEKKRIVPESTIADLELTQTIATSIQKEVLKKDEDEDEDEEKELEKPKPIYHYVLNLSLDPSSSSPVEDKNHVSKIVEQMARYYTTDTEFLKEYQELISQYSPVHSQNLAIPLNCMKDEWYEIKNDTGFKEKYYYINWPIWEFLNKSELFLQIMSIYNITSPILSLLLPVFILIIPFFIIKMKGLDITVQEYINILKVIAANHAFGKLFMEFEDVSTNHKMYLIISALFYVFSIYQNFLLCIRFYINMSKIHTLIRSLIEYLEYTSQEMNHYLILTEKYKSHGDFHTILREKMSRIQEWKKKLEKIRPYEFSLKSLNKIFEIGYVMKCFYEFHDEEEYHDLMNYSFGFHGYIECIYGLKQNVVSKQMNPAEFIRVSKDEYKGKVDSKEKEKHKRKEKKMKRKNKKEKYNYIRQNYYAVLKDSNPVKNDINLSSSLVITGPNASGKTTVLKSTLINLLLTQQFGFGFYEKAELQPFDFIHCYLNIPDTSGRDSLFQAEAKRCKEIINAIERTTPTLDKESDIRHFCVFDEIYSGTNPDEAVQSTVAFINYLVSFSNVSCILTTHFIKACKKLGKNERIQNYHMNVSVGPKINYTYKMKKGISEIKGGIQILKDMNYPQEIMNSLIKT